ncbi:MAG: SpoVA/SpoVAEb family sporulation membrane protein [Limnochordia bacterium]|jgi:stage V sporulation protein AC
MDGKAIDAQARYQKLVKETVPKPRVGRNLWRAFLVGGTLGVIGHLLYSLFEVIEPTRGESTATTLASLIFIGAVLTALGVYDSIAQWGGAGAAVPITGFANTIVAAAMEFRREGLILGLGSRMFVIAGPVLVYGTVAGFLTGLIKVAVMSLLR